MNDTTIPSYYDSAEQMRFVKHTIDNDVLCLGNEFQELYAQVNECTWFDDLSNAYTPIVTCKDEYFEHTKEHHGDDLRTLIDAMREWHENDGCDGFGPYDNYYNDYIEHLRYQQELQEVMQWFVVTEWLADHLKRIGEPVLSTNNHKLWGRTCCGQSIELDGTFQEIYNNINKGE